MNQVENKEDTSKSGKNCDYTPLLEGGGVGEALAKHAKHAREAGTSIFSEKMEVLRSKRVRLCINKL